jgi:elongation factor Ts
MEISATMVRDLRERTGAGLMECKRALEASKGDFEGAVDHLRKSGLKSAEKKASREMGEGRVQAYVAPKARVGTLIAVTCETDFMARTTDFETFLADMCVHIAEKNPRDAADLLTQKWSKSGASVGEAIKLLIGKLGENLQVARFQRSENMQGRIGSYVHHNQKVGAIASVTTGADENVASEVLKELCMHVAVFKPTAANRAAIPASEVERERAIYLEEVKSKPKEMQDKIVAGKLEKYYADAVLPEQKWFKDETKTVQQVLDERLGKGARSESFARFQIGA